MSKRIIKTVLSPVILALISIFAVFSVSADTIEEPSAPTSKISQGEKKISTLDEKIIDDENPETVPTMKPSYYTAQNSAEEVTVPTEYSGTENNAETSDTEPSSSVKTATPETGATSSISTYDTPSNSTVTTATTGVVQTSDTPIALIILTGLIGLCCLLIGLHKKNLVE